MFRIFDNFKAFDKNKQPYTFSVEKHTETANLRAGVTERGFALKAVGNRFILNSPCFKTGVFKTSFTISYPYEKNPSFQILFAYDKVHRTGKALQITYALGEKICVALAELESGVFTPISEEKSEKWVLPENGYENLTLEIKENSVSLEIGNAKFDFACDAKSGRLALDRQNFVGELILSEFSFVSNEEFQSKTVLETPKISVPLVNGGDIPYTVSYKIDEVEGEYYMTASLDGGTKSRPLNKNDRRGQYVTEIDWMTSPYFGIAFKNRDLIFNISDKENCFVDPNICWDCQKIFFGDTALPITNCYKLSIFSPNEIEGFIFGYENLRCKGYYPQSGGNEFRFSEKGELLYSGGALNGEDTFEIFSPFDKKAVSLIEKDIPDYENVINHLKLNHYFSFDENISLKLVLRTKINPDFLTVKAEIKNVFETEVISEPDLKIEIGSFARGYNEISAEAVSAPLKVGVYKIVFTVLYGESEHRTISRAFEVYDETRDVCPPLESGLPFMFTMNNEHKNLARNGFDLSVTKPSCDFGHYIACASNTPVEAERLEIWRNIKKFGRKWFAWLAIRTCDDYLSPKHDLTIKNADYLFHTGYDTDCDPMGPYSLFPNRIDYIIPYTFHRPGVKPLLIEFFKEHPHYAKEVGFDPTADLSLECYDKILSVCISEIIDYINKWKNEYIKNHNKELKKMNPNVKRAIYGPIAPYYAPTMTSHSLRDIGMPVNEELTKEYYSGFAIFEDYPFSCGYQTYRGPFAAMTLLLNHNDLAIYPELYSGSRGGCIDGAVKNAHAPMGEYTCSPHQNSTLALEYVFNTAYKTENGFAYWNKYGFHRGVETSEYMNDFVRNWHYVAEHKPKKPLRSIAYIVDYSGDENIYTSEFFSFNQSESAQTILHECARESGIPNGFGIKPEALLSLTEKDCDLLVIPSLKNADDSTISAIRRLYNAGVNLIALSDVSTLCDIFGVEKAPVEETVVSVEYGEMQENVVSTTATFKYRPTTASVCVTANESLPVIIKTKRTALINTTMFSLGCGEKSKTTCYATGVFVVGEVIRKALSDTVTKLSNPLVFGENVGTTLFEDESGSLMLFAVNYTPFDNQEEKPIEAVVKINLPDITEVSSDILVKAAKIDGKIKELRFDILPHGFAFIKLK